MSVDEPREPRAADYCPTCGESEATHTPQQAERCYESFLATDRLIHAAIDRATAARAKKPA